MRRALDWLDLLAQRDPDRLDQMLDDGEGRLERGNAQVATRVSRESCVLRERTIQRKVSTKATAL